MTSRTAILLIIIGCTAEMIALLNKKFYWLKGWMSGDREAPRWFGRLLFATVGALFFLVGLRYFLLGY